MSVLTQNNVSYFQLLDKYQKNKKGEINSWLAFETIFNRQGKQGIVGSLTLRGDSDQVFVFKLSQHINHLAVHEALVMKGLNSLANYCPHFCRSYGTIDCQVDPKIKREGNPFKIEDAYPIDKEVLLIEHIPGYKFLNHIKSRQIRDEIVYSIIKQVLLAILLAQRDKKFSHYDLHSNNIILRRCPEDVVLVYVIDEDNQFCVPTYGYYAVIIDFGFSYIDDMRDEPFWNTLAHTDVGFMTDRFDWVSDPKLFLISVTQDLKLYRDNHTSRTLRRIVKNIFSELKLDWESGWDDYEDAPAADEVLELLEDFNPGSPTFENLDHFGIDLIQSLIVLPMEPQKYKSIHKSFYAFLKEFKKIEEEINSEFYNLYMLKKIVDLARELRPDYLEDAKRETAVKEFKEGILDEIYKIAKFCHPRGISYDRMLCGLLLLGRSVEGMLHDLMVVRMDHKEKDYQKLPVEGTLDIFAAVEVNIPSEYEFTKGTEIVVLDSLQKNTKILQVSERNISDLNETEPSSRGVFIYDLLAAK